MSDTGNNMGGMFKRLVEAIRPDLDHYRKTPRKALVRRVNRVGDLRTLDVEILLNNGRADTAEPPLSRVPLTGGLVPKVGSTVILEYFRGDPAAPVVTGVVNQGRDNLSEVLMLADGGRRFRIDPDGTAWAEVSLWQWRRVE